MAELHVGAEWDRAAQRRLRDALREAGARRVGWSWRLAGSQDIFNATFAIAGGRLGVEVETYVGITVSGNDEALAILSHHL